MRECIIILALKDEVMNYYPTLHCTMVPVEPCGDMHRKKKQVNFVPQPTHKDPNIVDPH